jgi:very-short-patch-repair endonuclease
MAKRSAQMIEHARRMRQSPTRSEDRLWAWLRGRRFEGAKFRRQVPIGRYIADFYCAELKLVIEVDGTHHQMPGMLEYDEARSVELASRGIRVVRIANELLIRDYLVVVDIIRWALSPEAEEP